MTDIAKNDNENRKEQNRYTCFDNYIKKVIF